MTSEAEPVGHSSVEPAEPAEFVWHDDCRHFNGGMPCKHWRPCHGCSHHDPVTHRVLIVLLRRFGDLLIASPLPARIKRDHPGAHITWLVDDTHAPVVEMNPFVDRVVVLDWRTATSLRSETFDAVYGFERRPHAAALVDQISATHKAGLAHGGPNNTLYPIGEPARHFFKLNTWNDYRTRSNTTTWTELYFQVAGYTYHGEPYALDVPPEARRDVTSAVGPAPRICLNVGGSRPTKIWPLRLWVTLGRALLNRGFQLIITGGPDDHALTGGLHTELAAEHPGRVAAPPLTIHQFAAVPALCEAIVTGDTLGYHLALAHQRPSILLLGPSNGAEVIPKHDTTTTALRSTFGCSPCANQVACGGQGGCMDTISPDDVLHEIDTRIATP